MDENRLHSTHINLRPFFLFVEQQRVRHQFDQHHHTQQHTQTSVCSPNSHQTYQSSISSIEVVFYLEHQTQHYQINLDTC